MSRKIIKIDAGREDWESGSLLKADERFQTDAEWHGSILEDIHYSLNNSLQDIYGALDDIRGYLEEINNYHKANPPSALKPMEQKQSAWQFVISWIIIIVLFAIYYAK